jgi:hypothetical protein
MKMKTLLALGSAMIAALASSAQLWAAPGDVWSLAGDMQIVSNPSPPIDPGAPGGGTATWTYLSGSGPYTVSTSNLVTDVNPEVPDAGIGWFDPTANHVMLAKFSANFNPPAPAGSGNDKTNFLIGDVGGHATTGALWTTDHAGLFQAKWLGYNARNQATANGNEKGRQTMLHMYGPTGADLDLKPIVGGGGFDGSANAYMNSAVVSLSAGGALKLMQEGSEWSGLGLTITELAVPEPASAAMAAVGLGMMTAMRRRRR